MRPDILGPIETEEGVEALIADVQYKAFDLNAAEFAYAETAAEAAPIWGAVRKDTDRLMRKLSLV